MHLKRSLYLGLLHANEMQIVNSCNTEFIQVFFRKFVKTTNVQQEDDPELCTCA